MQEYTLGKRRQSYELVYRDKAGKRHRHTLNTADEGEAERTAPAVYAELIAPKERTVAALWEAYNHDKAGRAVLTPRVTTWKALRARFGHRQAEGLTVEDCRAHIVERRAAGRKDGTIYTELSHLRTTLTWAVKHQLIRYAPYIERPPQPGGRERHLTKEESRRLLAAAVSPHIRLFIILALGTGARTAALLGLRWVRCDFTRLKIDLRDPDLGAPHKGRAIVPMNRMVVDALREARERAQTPYVIEYRGSRIAAVKRSLKAAARRAALTDVSPHVLRHSAAVWLAEADVPMEKIAQYLGHSDIKVTRRIYARFSPSHLRDAAGALEL